MNTDPMTPEKLAARWMADIKRGGAGAYWVDYNEAIAAIARHLAPVDDLVEAERPADTMRKMAEMLPMGSAIRIAAFASADTITALLARIAALTATVAELKATVAEVTSDRAYIIGANAGWEAAVEQGQATPAAQAVLARAEAAEAECEALCDRLAKDAKAHEKEIAVWSENYAAMERRLSAQTAQVRELTQERDRIAKANHRQAYCIQLTAQAVGVGISGAMDELPKEAATLRARLARMEGALRWVIENNDEGNGLYSRDGTYAKRARAALTDGGSNG